jgi:dimethylargininase
VLFLEGCISKEELQPVGRTIVVPREEHLAANCVGANGFVVVPANCPKTVKALEQAGKKILSVEMSEFQKMDGRLTCLSILF